MKKLLKIIGHKLFDAIIIVWKLSWMSHFAMIGKKATDINQVQYLSSNIFCNNNRGLAHNMIYEWTNKIFFQKKCRVYFLELENTSYLDRLLHSLAVMNIHIHVKFIYSEKATKFCKICTVDFTGNTKDKSTVEILQNFVAFSEYMNFN